MLGFFLCAATVLALTGCGGASEGQPVPSQSTSTPAATANGPDISGAGLENEALSTQDFRGKPVFVNVWSSW